MIRFRRVLTAISRTTSASSSTSRRCDRRFGAPFAYAPFTQLAERTNPRAVPTVERDLREGDELSAEYRALSHRIGLADLVAGIVVLVAAFFMVVKP